MSHPPTDPIPRFWMKVDKTDTCWLWTGGLFKGYGTFKVNGVTTGVHRFAYGLLVAPIPAGMTVDHRCHDPRVCHLGQDCPHRRCVNPAHMTLTTIGENTSRTRASSANRLKTHCKNGHPFDEENTYLNPAGWRYCRTCHRSAVNEANHCKSRDSTGLVGLIAPAALAAAKKETA